MDGTLLTSPRETAKKKSFHSPVPQLSHSPNLLAPRDPLYHAPAPTIMLSNSMSREGSGSLLDELDAEALDQHRCCRRRSRTSSGKEHSYSGFWEDSPHQSMHSLPSTPTLASRPCHSPPWHQACMPSSIRPIPSLDASPSFQHSLGTPHLHSTPRRSSMLAHSGGNLSYSGHLSAALSEANSLATGQQTPASLNTGQLTPAAGQHTHASLGSPHAASSANCAPGSCIISNCPSTSGVPKTEDLEGKECGSRGRRSPSAWGVALRQSMPGALPSEGALQSASSLSSYPTGFPIQLSGRRGSSSQLWCGALLSAATRSSSGALPSGSSLSSQAGDGSQIGGETDNAGGVCGMGRQASQGEGASRASTPPLQAWTPPPPHNKRSSSWGQQRLQGPQQQEQEHQGQRQGKQHQQQQHQQQEQEQQGQWQGKQQQQLGGQQGDQHNHHQHCPSAQDCRAYQQNIRTSCFSFSRSSPSSPLSSSLLSLTPSFLRRDSKDGKSAVDTFFRRDSRKEGGGAAGDTLLPLTPSFLRRDSKNGNSAADAFFRRDSKKEGVGVAGDGLLPLTPSFLRRDSKKEGGGAADAFFRQDSKKEGVGVAGDGLLPLTPSFLRRDSKKEGVGAAGEAFLRRHSEERGGDGEAFFRRDSKKEVGALEHHCSAEPAAHPQPPPQQQSMHAARSPRLRRWSWSLSPFSSYSSTVLPAADNSGDVTVPCGDSRRTSGQAATQADAAGDTEDSFIEQLRTLQHSHMHTVEANHTARSHASKRSAWRAGHSAGEPQACAQQQQQQQQQSTADAVHTDAGNTREPL